METTIQTFKETRMPFGIQRVTPITSLRGVGRINVNNPNSFSKSFVFNKELQLLKSPLVNPFIVFSCFSDITQVFHNNHISSIQIINNSFADVMVGNLHKPFPSSRDFFQLSLGGLRAFRLKNRNEFITLNSQLFDIFSIEFIVGSDSEFINSQVHSKNPTMLVRIYGAFLGECKSEIMFIFRLSQKTFNNFPIIKIFQSIIRNFNRNLNSTLDSGDTQNIIFETKTTRSIISHRDFKDIRIRFSFLNNTTRLFNTSNRKLRRQTHLPQIFIDKRMELNIISNLHSPSNVNTMLESFFVEFNSFQNNFINFNFNWDRPYQHCKDLRNSNYLNISENSIPPKPKDLGILEQVI